MLTKWNTQGVSKPSLKVVLFSDSESIFSPSVKPPVFPLELGVRRRSHFLSGPLSFTSFSVNEIFSLQQQKTVCESVKLTLSGFLLLLPLCSRCTHRPTRRAESTPQLTWHYSTVRSPLGHKTGSPQRPPLSLLLWQYVSASFMFSVLFLTLLSCSFLVSLSVHLFIFIFTFIMTSLQDMVTKYQKRQNRTWGFVCFVLSLQHWKWCRIFQPLHIKWRVKVAAFLEI